MNYKIDINTLHRDKSADTLELNEIGRVQIETSSPLFFDEYNRNRETGGFILIDPATNRTVAAGMIRGQVKSYESPQGKYDTEISSNVTWEQRNVTRLMYDAGFIVVCHGRAEKTRLFLGVNS